MRTLKLFIFTAFLSVGFISTASAQFSETLKGAATGCFPRVFSQINQFKSSSGGLRNLNANPRTIVCSIDINDHETLGIEDIRVFVSFLDNDAPGPGVSCTLFVRDTQTGGLVDSQTIVYPAGQNGRQSSFFELSKDDTYENYTFLQCTLPSNTRMLQMESYYGV